MSVKVVKWLFLIFGLGMLALAINETSVEETILHLTKISWQGILVVLVLYSLAFLIDTITWTITIISLPVNMYSIWKTFLVRIVGEAFNNTIPAGGVGGEPVKAILLKAKLGIGYRDGAVSLVLAKTINMLALSLFLILGFLIMMSSSKLSTDAKQVALFGLIGIVTLTALFFLIQNVYFATRVSRFFTSLRLGYKFKAIHEHIKDFDKQISHFYRSFTGRFGLSIILAIINWLLGVVEIYIAMHFLGSPVSWAEAYIIESVTQMVRLGTFFIPMSLGAQEGAFLLVVSAITGSSSIGLALGIVRRIREIIWIGLGLLVGIRLS